MKIIVGHKSPDTDATCSAIAYSRILGKNYEPRIMSPVNRETEYVLKKFGFKTPQIWKGEGEEIILVDHNEAEQSVGNYDKVVEIIDHHKLNISTEKSISVLVKPLGSTCTILANKYPEKIDKKLAGILLSAILSDTVVFKSPTTTQEDIITANKLAKIVGVNAKSYGIEMKKAGMSLEGMTPKQVVMKDYKEYTLKGKKFFIGQVEVADMKEVLKMKEDLLQEMKQMKYDYVLLMLTDIITETTELLIFGDEQEIGKVFDKIPVNNSINLPNVLSRKKQVVPKITKHFS